MTGKPPTRTPNLLTVQDVADCLKSSTKQVRRLISAGDLPAIRIGRLIRVSETDLNAFLAARRSL